MEQQWIAIEQSEGVLQLHVGTGAGVPLSGLVAAAALSQVTKKIQNFMVDEGRATYLDVSHTASIFSAAAQ